MKTLLTLIRNTGILVLFIMPTLLSAQTKSTTYNQPYSTAVPDNQKTTYQQISVYPNPTKDFIEFKVDSKYDDVAIITFYDSKGMVVATYKQQVSQGVNYMKMDVTKFASGSYIMTVEISGTGYVAKFMKY